MTGKEDFIREFTRALNQDSYLRAAFRRAVFEKTGTPSNPEDNAAAGLACLFPVES